MSSKLASQQHFVQHQKNGIAVKHTEIAMFSKSNETSKTEIKRCQKTSEEIQLNVCLSTVCMFILQYRPNALNSNNFETFSLNYRYM